MRYKSIYDLDSLSKKKWNEYFEKGKVYIDKDVTSTKISQRILFDKSITEFFGKTESSTKWREQIQYTPTKRKYVVGGRCGKVKGFNFYLQKNEKFKPFERRKLLSQSEDLITQLIDEETKRMGSIENINKDISVLDCSLSDLELKEIWNNLYDEYGYRFDRFKDKWEREKFGVIKDFGNKKDELKSFTPLKIDWIEKRNKKVKLYDMG